MDETLIPNIEVYAARNQLAIKAPLGSGKDGIVYAASSMAPGVSVALKALRSDALYLRERLAYERLAAFNVTSVHGFNVPSLLGCADELRVIEMTIVRRPFVLDFAGARLDWRPEFPPGVWEEWESVMHRR